MKTLLLALVLAAACCPLFGQTYAPATDVATAIRESYIMCFANHWKGTESRMFSTLDWSVRLNCEKFWRSEHNPKLASPFDLIIPGQEPEEIPYSIWGPAIEDVLKISKEPK